MFAPAGLSTRYFDLQIIRGLPQVKTPSACFGGLARISLGFKQLARRLHGAILHVAMLPCVSPRLDG
jgi:hypothetical protein